MLGSLAMGKNRITGMADGVAQSDAATVGQINQSNNTYSTLTDFRAAPVSDIASLYDNSLWFWTLGDYSALIDNRDYVKADSTANSAGAWVRQPSEIDAKRFGAKPKSPVTQALTDSFNALSSTRVSPIGLTGWGMGTVTLPRGEYTMTAPWAPTASAIGYKLRGVSKYATSIRYEGLTSGSAFTFLTYVALVLEDFRLANTATDPGTSVGVLLDGTGGGGDLAMRRVAIEGFNTAVSIAGTTNGDKTLYEQVNFGGGRYGWTNGQNTQAICHHFLNCIFGNFLAHHYYTGSGEMLVTQASGNINNALLRIGNNAGTEVAGRVVYYASAYEMQGTGDHMVIDAREATTLAGAGGANVHVVFRDSRFDGGDGQTIDWANKTVIKIGDAGNGSDAVTWAQHGGRVPPGRVELSSQQMGPNNMLSVFRDAEQCPPPERVQFQGSGNHMLLEWDDCDGVLNQYRGGQNTSRAMKAEMQRPWNHVGRALVNTGVAATSYQVDTGAGPVARFGGQFTVGPFPDKCTVTGMAVFIDNEGQGTDTVVEWFGDAAFTTRRGFAVIPANATPGLYPVVMYDASKWMRGASSIYVRITKPGTGQASTAGKLLIYYNPYMGT